MSSNLLETPAVGNSSYSPGWRRKSPRLDQEEDGETSPEIRVQERLPLPPELMSQTLLYLDAESLFQAFQVSQSMRMIIKVQHWRTSATPMLWLQRPVPNADSFTTDRLAVAYWKRLCRSTAAAASGNPTGRLVVLGGSEPHVPGPTRMVETCMDVAWGTSLKWEPLQEMMMENRCAAAAAVDRWGDIYVVGGWSGHETCRSGEVLSHLGDSNVPAAWRYRCPPRLPSSGYADRHEGRASGSGMDVMENNADSSSPCGPKGDGDSAGDDGGASTEFSACEARLSQAPGAPDTRGMGLKGARRWSALPRMSRPRCFLGAVFEPGGGLIAVGGGTGLYTNATAFDTVEVLRPDSRTWESGPTMQESRCGLGVTTLPDGTIYAAGGYAGNMLYLRSAEALHPYSDRWVRLPPMGLPRTGLGLAAGPDKRLYAVGGSADGSHGHSTMESFDPREGKWSACQPMVCGRAYCCAAFGASGCLYVLGGMSTPMGLRRTVEIYDPRTERWRVDDRSGSGGRAITDACLVLQPRS